MPNVWPCYLYCNHKLKKELLSGFGQPYVVSRCRLMDDVHADFYGMDIGNAPAVDVHECGFLCDDNDNCHAFTWTNYNGGTCWMKSQQPRTVTSPPGLSGLSYKCQPKLQNYDFAGGDITNTHRPHWRHCSRDCRVTQGCAAFSWSNYNGGICWLKNATALPSRSTTQGSFQRRASREPGRTAVLRVRVVGQPIHLNTCSCLERPLSYSTLYATALILVPPPFRDAVCPFVLPA